MNADHAPGGLDLAAVLRAAWRERRRIVLTCVGAFLLTLGIAFLLPRWYRSTAVILPPDESDLLSNLSVAQRALTKFPTLGVLPDIFTPADIFKAVLLSRTVQEEVVEAHDIQRVYRQKSLEKTLRKLRDNYRVKLNADGTISISVDDRDPRRAAAMAGTFVEGLNRFNVEKRNNQARRTRIFLEHRVAEVDSSLRAGEEALRKYQESHYTVTPPTSSSGDAQAAADILARKMMLEVRLGVLRSYLREDNEQVVQTRLELDQLKSRIASLPALQNELVRRIRDVKLHEQLYLLLTAELEQARIREMMDTPTVQVLDPPRVPERHVWPRRFLLALAGAVLAFLGSLAYIALRESPGAPAARSAADPR
jgi:uncharacterized protein involved in exopolysaccharide biosynthesis